MEQKYQYAIKFGFICGLVPAIIYGLALLSFSIVISSIGFFSYVIMAIISGAFPVYYSNKYLHSIKNVAIISGLAGTVNGITYSVSGIIIEIMLQQGANYVNIGHRNFLGISDIFGISSIILTNMISIAMIAIIAGIIYYKFFNLRQES